MVSAILACAEDTSSTTSTSTVRPYSWTPRYNDPNWNTRWNQHVPQTPNWGQDRNNWNRWNHTGYQGNDWNRNRWDTRYDAAYPRDWRTLRLDEKADARGYVYVYDTVAGIVAEETGVFEGIGLRHEGQKIHGQVIITDPRDGVIYKINYQAESKEPYVHRGSREAERVPPTIARLLALLEAHK